MYVTLEFTILGQWRILYIGSGCGAMRYCSPYSAALCSSG